MSATCVALTLATHLIGAGSGVHGVPVVAVLGLLVTTVLLAAPDDHSDVGPGGGLSMALAHTVAALVIGVGIAIND